MSGEPGPELLPKLLELARDYLGHNGWFESVRTSRAVGPAGPLPWLTYPAIEMLRRIDVSAARVFEYGAGNSSLWWAARALEVVSVESDPSWERFLSGRPPANHRVLVIEKDAPPDPVLAGRAGEFFRRGLDPEPEYRHGPSPSVACRPYVAYAMALLRYPAGHFDVIVIDGAARVLCAWLAAEHLSGDGFLVFDNTDRVIYENAYRLLAERGFARLDFWGPSPMNTYESCTSIFTRTLAPFLAPRRRSVLPRPEHYWR